MNTNMDINSAIQAHSERLKGQIGVQLLNIFRALLKGSAYSRFTSQIVSPE
jgi:hypothetical protein